MLRGAGLLPSQLRAAYEICLRTLDGEDAEEKIAEWFGKSREFLPDHQIARTPLLNNILRGAIYRDQHGRTYSYADPTYHEYEEPDGQALPMIIVTDRLFVATPQRARERDIWVPEVGETLRLRRIDDPIGVELQVDVLEVIEPADNNPRVATGLVQLDGGLAVEFNHKRSAQVMFEALLRHD